MLFIVAAVIEFLTMLFATILRYSFQGLNPELFDFSKLANIIGLAIEAPVIVTFLLLAFISTRPRTSLAVSMVLLSGVGLVTLTITATMSTLSPVDGKLLIPAPGTQYILAGVLVIKAFEVSMLFVLLRGKSRTGLGTVLRITGTAYSIIAIALAGVITAVLLSPIDNDIAAGTGKQWDAAVVLGAAVWSHNKPSPVLRERIKRGYDLLKNSDVQFIVATGGSAPGELAEAEVTRRELIALGADPTRIVTESRTNSTEEQIFYIRDQLYKQGWKSFVIVSDQFHLRRALEICRFNGVNAVGVSSESPLGTQSLAFYNLRESAALLLYWIFGM